jgi:bis(5'-nucleosyl)-tetraphosphatase (symmetrical)
MPKTSKPSTGNPRNRRAGSNSDAIAGIYDAMRWVVGDIHGCAEPFERLLTAIRFDPARDELWVAGDLVNKGPDSVAVMELWESVGGRSVLGNHDVYALLAAAGVRDRRRDTLDGLFGDPRADRWLAAMRALPLLVRLPGDPGPDAWLVHAGLHPAWEDLAAIAAKLNAPPHDDAWLQAPATAFATRARCSTADGAMSPFTGPPEGAPDGFEPWDHFYRGAELVVHGHWAARGAYRSGRVIGLDSGCVYGGKLTAWCQDEDRLVQV